MTDLTEPPPGRDRSAFKAFLSTARRLAPWLMLTPFAVWAVVRVFGVERGYPGFQLVSFTPYVAVLSLFPVAVALLLRTWWAAAAATVVTLVLAASVLPRWVSDSDALPAGASGPTVRFLSANLHYGEGDAATVVRLVREQRVDVLALQEYTPEAQQSLAALGLDALLPEHALVPWDGVAGSAIYSRYPLRDDGGRANPGGFRQARATLTVPGAAPVLMESVHPVAPTSRAATPYLLAGLAAEPVATPDGPVRLLVGDFNATLDHAALRRLLDTGYRDAAAVVGQGLTPTWPYYGPRIELYPKITIDHVLADPRIGVARVVVFPVPRTDHRAVLAELVLPPA
jgi:endonuclease/exonuclease/phosphatase (EEP) superfamily protein YafD